MDKYMYTLYAHRIVHNAHETCIACFIFFDDEIVNRYRYACIV